MVNIIKSFSYPTAKENMIEEAKKIASREGKSLSQLITNELEDYVKIHKEGNPQHEITKFMENEDFTGFPAMGIDFFHKKEYIKKYLQKGDRMNDLGKELWGHVLQWQSELQKL